MSNQELQTGVVKWFNESKGFGFITPNNGGKDLFVHFSDIISDAFKTLNEGDRVSYTVGHTDRGDAAKTITVI